MHNVLEYAYHPTDAVFLLFPTNLLRAWLYEAKGLD
jgi:hypothetical protein